jgi:hypothetical protein
VTKHPQVGLRPACLLLDDPDFLLCQSVQLIDLLVNLPVCRLNLPLAHGESSHVPAEGFEEWVYEFQPKLGFLVPARAIIVEIPLVSVSILYNKCRQHREEGSSEICVMFADLDRGS